MKTLIIFAGRSGSTMEIAHALRKAAGTGTELLDLSSGSHRRKVRKLNLSTYDAVILGGSIRAGKMPRPLVKFAAGKTSTLASCRLGLFVCCLDETKAYEYMTAGYGEELVSAAVHTEWMGGRYQPEEHGKVIQALMRKILGSDEPVDTLRRDAVTEFIREVLA